MFFETPDDFVVVDPVCIEQDAQEEENFLASSCLDDLSRLTVVVLQLSFQNIRNIRNKIGCMCPLRTDR